MSLPSEKDVKSCIEDLLQDGDMENMTVKIIRCQLEDRFNADLTSMKSFIKETITKLVEKHSDRDIIKLSSELSAFLNHEEFTDRDNLTAAIIDYAKKTGLIDPENDKIIICDDALEDLLNRKKISVNKIFEKLIENRHLPEFVEDVEQESNAEEHTVAKRITRSGGLPKKRKAKTKGEPKERKKYNGKVMQISDDLALIVGANQMQRTEVVKKLWEYIRKHNLQNPANKREILCDSVFKRVMGKDKVTMFNMNRFISPHITNLDED